MANQIQRTLHGQVVAMGLPFRQVSAERDGSVIYKLHTPAGLGGLALIVQYDYGHDLYRVTRVTFDEKMNSQREVLGLFFVEDLGNIWTR